MDVPSKHEAHEVAHFVVLMAKCGIDHACRRRL